jgi:hypothetical protein
MRDDFIHSPPATAFHIAALTILTRRRSRLNSGARGMSIAAWPLREAVPVAAEEVTWMSHRRIGNVSRCDKSRTCLRMPMAGPWYVDVPAFKRLETRRAEHRAHR